MQQYRKFSPTAYDTAGLGADRLDCGAWLVAPVSQTRDSGALDRSNFACALRELGGESDTVEVREMDELADELEATSEFDRHLPDYDQAKG